MSEHKMKEIKEKAAKELREKIRNRLTADDVTFADFSAIDGSDIRTRPSLNDVTTIIWSDIINAIEEFSMTFYGRNNNEAYVIAAQVLDEIGNIIIEKFSTMPIPYDNRYYSEIMADEHVTLETAKFYKKIINLGIDCVSVNELTLSSKIGNEKIVNIFGIEKVVIYFFSAKKLLEKQIGKIKIKDLLN